MKSEIFSCSFCNTNWKEYCGDCNKDHSLVKLDCGHNGCSFVDQCKQCPQMQQLQLKARVPEAAAASAALIPAGVPMLDLDTAEHRANREAEEEVAAVLLPPSLAAAAAAAAPVAFPNTADQTLGKRKALVEVDKNISTARTGSKRVRKPSAKVVANVEASRAAAAGEVYNEEESA